MATYKELCETYKKRRYSHIVDSVAAGLSHADAVALDLGALDPFGDMAEALEQVSLALPFAIILATEGGKVIMGKKKGTSGVKDAAYRSFKSGVAIAAGSGAAALAGGFAAVPTAISVRLLIDRYRSKALLGRRLSDRTQSLRFLSDKWRDKAAGEARPLALPEANPIAEPILQLG